jgi:hypothetical protein
MTPIHSLPISSHGDGVVEPTPAQAVILSLPAGGKRSQSDRKGAFPTHEISHFNRRGIATIISRLSFRSQVRKKQLLHRESIP